MNAFLAALWAETLKARRSRVTWGTTAGFLILPLIGGLFMIILKNPEQARALGLISVKAQLVGGTADWPAFWSLLTQGAAVGGGMIFAFITAWVFGREFSDHTVKELLALPTRRETIVGAKFVLLALWFLGLTLLVFVVALGVGAAVGMPGWSLGLAWASGGTLLLIAWLLMQLMPLVALAASAGRGYLPPLGWALSTLVFAQIAVVLGWGDWFPWAVPALASGMAGLGAERIALHSYLVVFLVFVVGMAATFAWWQRADQAR